jgi:chemotaxis protein histidine kinase CheA/ActR/RegA family two-component response regulator
MNEEAQKRILNYFIEEARDHLATIEQGLLSLRDTVGDPEQINELFRAAHSIKGGAAMLGLTSIQRTAHRLEDFFNIFRSRPGEVPVDQHLETLLLQVFDGLTALLDELQSPQGLTQEFSASTLAGLEPVFQEAEKHIRSLLGEGPPSIPAPAVAPPSAARSLQQEMVEVVPQQLRQMLELFKQGDQPGVREQLREANAVLKQIGQTHHLKGWQQLTETFEQALGNPNADLRTLALIALRDFKQGQQLILAGRAEEVSASAELQQLARPAAPAAPPNPLDVVIQQRIPALLRQMLELFKRPDDPATRPALQSIAQSLQEVGQAEGVDLGGWTALARLVGEILADPAQDLRQVALPVLRDLKQAHQALASGAAQSIQPSAELLAFRRVPTVAEEAESELSSAEPEAVLSAPALSRESGLEEALEAESQETEHPELGRPEMPAEKGIEEDGQAAADLLTQEGLAGSAEMNWLQEEGAPRADWAVGGGDFDATPLSLEEEVSLAFEELFANAEQLSDIEEPPPELIPPASELSSAAFEELIPEERRAEADLAALFAEVVGEATAEAGSAERTEAEDTGQALWNVTEEELTAQAPAERPTASLDFAAASGGVETPFELGEVAVESSPLPDLESTPRVELWAEVEEGSPAEESLEDLLGAAELAWSEAAEQSEGLEEPEVAAAQGFTAELSLAELLASETVEAPENQEEWALLEQMFPAPEEEPSAAAAASFSEDSLNCLEALFAEEAEAEELGREAGEPSSAVDTDGDSQIDLEELSRFFAAAADTQEGASLGDLEASPASNLAAEVPPEVAEEGRALQSAEEDLARQLESLFAEDESLAAPGATVAEGKMKPPAEEALEGSSSPSLDDLAALFDAAEPAVTPKLEEATAPPAEAASDFAAQLELLLGDLEVAPQASAAPPPPAVTAPAATPAVPATPATPASRRAALGSSVMRVEVRHLDFINNLVGELVVIRNSIEQNQTRLRQFLDGLLSRVQQLGELGQRMRDQYDRSLLEAALFSGRRSTAAVGSSRNGEGSSRARVGHSTGQEFDKLEMDQFTAFHALAQEIIELIVRVRESSSDIEFAVNEAEQIARQFRQVTAQLQEGLNRARMVPFAQIADRLPRAVRDLSLKTGKQASLVVEGRDTLIDKAILEELSDPLTHLVNNALVHGIEPPEERRRLGKPPEGKITVKAFYQGNQAIIVVSDDGAGIPVEKVKAKAQRLGLLSEEATEDEVFGVLFHPGFSSREASEVDDLAGRGVGLDVVRRNITALRGSIQVDSVRGRGTTFTICLPLTLSISKAMVCVSDKALIAFPLDGVEEMLDVPVDAVQPDEQGRPTIPWRDQRLPFQPLSSLLSYSRSHSRSRSEVYTVTQDEGIIPIVVLQSAGQYLALQVDSFVEEQEIVIKQLRGPVPKPPGISGVTVLGNGRVLPIADVLELVDMAQGRRRDLSRLWAERRAEEPRAEETHQTTVLIVDDSITVRELLSMSFQKVGYRVEQARDGQDAWEKLRGGLRCDLVFCDIEMPRMDGLELLSRIRADSNLKHIPVAMLTSRGAERHRQTARELGATAYFTKPYLEEELLSAAARMLQGEQLLKPAPPS